MLCLQVSAGCSLSVQNAVLSIPNPVHAYTFKLKQSGDLQVATELV